MAPANPHIDPHAFDDQFKKFCSFIQEKSPQVQLDEVDSFGSHPFIRKHEGYKYDVHAEARSRLGFENWTKPETGEGNIINAAIDAVETPENNLVQWRNKDQAKQVLLETLDDPTRCQKLELCLFELFRDSHERETFSALQEFFGKKYSLIAYFFFLKDSSKYLPIAPTYFDKAFEALGVEFKTSHRCSWENYSIYMALLGELKVLLEESLPAKVTLLDAHTFAWMLASLASQMAEEGKLADHRQFAVRSETERDALIKARVCQGKFRKMLLDYWGNCCAVTGCKNDHLLRASHIKPWAKSSPDERLCVYNGLLLSPHLDACFDSGLVSFDDAGRILVSSKLSEEDLKALGLHRQMRITEAKIDSKHKKYLAHHRACVLQKDQ